MNRKLLAITAISMAVLALCGVGMLLTGLAGWRGFQPAPPGRAIRVSLLAPLATPSGPAVQTEFTAEPLPTPTAPVELALPAPTTMPEPSPTPNVEKILGFALPQGAVNSVTQQGVATRLIIPKLNLDASVVISPIKNQTWQVDHLEQAVGHLEGTAPPGAASNIVLAGHVTLSEGVYGPFAGLGQLVPGDILTVYEGNQKYNYVVDDYDIVERTAIEVTRPTNTPRITLITCTRWNQQEGRYEQRLVVKGHLAP